MRISDWSSDVCSSDLIPQRPQLPAPGPRTRRRNPRKLAPSHPLPQYGRTARAEENRTPQRRMTHPLNANLQTLTHTTQTRKVPIGYEGVQPTISTRSSGGTLFGDDCATQGGVPRTRRRNPRKLARSQPLPQYGRTARAEENRTTQSRMTSTMTANLQNLTHTTQ